MKRLYFLLLVLATAVAAPVAAQLPDGVVAPDFTATDIQGNTWNLYDLLDQGKSVVLHFGATWCGDCWEYHQSGVLAELTAQYGSTGTDEMVAFFIETDDGTTTEDLAGTGSNTQGDWISGTPHPILDDAAWLGNLYALDDVPRIYHVCPSRILTNAAGVPAWALHERHLGCEVPFGQFNAAMVRYDGFQGEFCGETTFQPVALFQNLGSENISNLTLQLFLNGNLAETRHWTGNLPQFQTAGTAFNPVSVTQSTTLEIVVQSVNGQPDEAPGNDTLQAQAMTAVKTASNFLTLELKTDDYPTETYWEILDANGNVFQRGGNPGIFTGEYLEGTYEFGATVYEHAVTLPADGCYEFVIYDSYDDGICCGGGVGYYRLLDENNFILLQGGLFTGTEHRPFELSGAGTIHDNAAIKSYLGASGDFCGTPEIVPVFEVQNLGANAINSLEMKALKNGVELQTFTWAGDILPSQTAQASMNPLTLGATGNVDFLISKVNGQPDTFDFQNKTRVSFFRRQPQTNQLILEFATDEWPWENYWQITNSAGELIASGCNQNVGATGGGLQVAQAGDPGAYPAFSVVTEQITLPDSLTDCYEFLFVDDWGDGIFQPGYIKLTDANGNLLFDFRPLFTYDSRLIDGQFAPSAAGENAGEPATIRLSPNPASSELRLVFSLKNAGNVSLEITDALGKIVWRERENWLGAGEHRRTVEVQDWSGGVYFLKIRQADFRQVARRFVVFQK